MGVSENFDVQVWRLAWLLWNNLRTRLTWHSDPADSGIPIGPCSDGIANNRRPHGEVAVLECRCLKTQMRNALKSFRVAIDSTFTEVSDPSVDFNMSVNHLILAQVHVPSPNLAGRLSAPCLSYFGQHTLKFVISLVRSQLRR